MVIVRFSRVCVYVSVCVGQVNAFAREQQSHKNCKKIKENKKRLAVSHFWQLARNSSSAANSADSKQKNSKVFKKFSHVTSTQKRKTTTAAAAKEKHNQVGPRQFSWRRAVVFAAAAAVSGA